MNDWQSTYLGRGALPRDLSGFEIEAFFTYSESERRVIDDERRSPALKLALALQIGFLRMTGRLLEALRLVPPALWRHLGAQFEIDAPDLASLRTMYRRRRTLFEQQDLACSVLGFHDVTEAQRRALVRAINAELSRTSDRRDCCSSRADGSTIISRLFHESVNCAATSPRRFASMRRRWLARSSRRSILICWRSGGRRSRSRERTV
jgi:hypothetical protein